MDANFDEIMTLTGGLGFIKGYVNSAIENAALYPDSYDREALLARLKTISAKVAETFDERDKQRAELSQVRA